MSNTHFFNTTKELEFSWVVHGDGSLLGSGLLPLLVIKPQSSYDIEFISSPWYSLWASSLATKVFLTITVKLSKSTRWAVAGHILASTQLQLPAKQEFGPHVIKATGGPILGKCLGDTIRVSKQDSWEININAQTGTIESWKVEGVSVMNKGIFPCLWRAPTDNDKGGGETSYASKWRAAFLDNLFFHIASCSIQDVTDYTVKIAIVYLGIRKNQGSTLSSSERSNTTIFKVEMMYTIYGSGDVILELNVCPRTDLPLLPRVGVEFHVDKSLDQIKWYGRGPFECYPDRKEAAHVGVYQENVGNMHVPNIVPGESSGRADIRWVALRNSGGYGIFASVYDSSPLMQMNASNYSTMELDRATHNEELVEGDTIEVHLDHKHMGVGGDNIWTRVYMISI